jgi:16S rRNA (guanine966-N2)-methyltransferase
VIAGQFRGRRLVAPEGNTTRPTSDKVRQATFNALESLDVIGGARVLDLFAGSGALAIEALSRGAAHATCVENDRRALAAITANAAAFGLGADRLSVVRRSAWDVIGAPLASTAQKAYDVVLCDPPYTFDEWERLCEEVPGTWLVIESSRPVDVTARWETVRQKTYGTTVVTIARRAGDA